MQNIELPIEKETKVIVTDQNGKSREGTVINHHNGKYLVKFPDTSMSEFWSPEYVKAK
jgi:hypothetical protein